MGEKGEGSGGEEGGKWGRRGREVGGKGEGTGNGVPPCPPPLFTARPNLIPYAFIWEKILKWSSFYNCLSGNHIYNYI